MKIGWTFIFCSINCVYVHTWEVEKKNNSNSSSTSSTSTYTLDIHTFRTHSWVNKRTNEQANRVSEWEWEKWTKWYALCIKYSIYICIHTTNFDAIRFFFISLLAFVNFSIRLLWTILYFCDFFLLVLCYLKPPVYWIMIICIDQQ